MKKSITYLFLIVIVAVSTAFSPTKEEKPKEEKIEVTVTWTNYSSGIAIQMEDVYRMYPSQRKQFMKYIEKKHKVSFSNCNCTTIYLQDECICATKCCTWGGIEVGEVCTSWQRHDCTAQQLPCD